MEEVHGVCRRRWTTRRAIRRADVQSEAKYRSESFVDVDGLTWLSIDVVMKRVVAASVMWLRVTMRGSG